MLEFWKTKRTEVDEVDPTSKKATLFAGCPIPEFAKASPIVARLLEISTEREELSLARRTTKETIADNAKEIERLEAERVERLADLARLRAKNLEDPDFFRVKTEEADRMRGEAADLRRRVADDEKVLETLENRAKAFDEELVALRMQYTREVGRLLEAIFAHLAEQYMAKAPELAELTKQIAAVQDVMMHFRSGNSNGFDRQAYIPRVEPGSMEKLAPLFDCSLGLSEQTQQHRTAIINSLGAIGYTWRFEG